MKIVVINGMDIYDETHKRLKQFSAQIVSVA